MPARSVTEGYTQVTPSVWVKNKDLISVDTGLKIDCAGTFVPYTNPLYNDQRNLEQTSYFLQTILPRHTHMTPDDVIASLQGILTASLKVTEMPVDQAAQIKKLLQLIEFTLFSL